MRFSCSTIATLDIIRIVIAIAIQIQAVDGFGIQVGSIVGGDKPSPLGAVVSGVAVVQTGVVIVIVATVPDRIGVGHIVTGSFAGNGTVAPDVVQILGLQHAVGIVDGNHIALQVSLEVVEAAYTAGGQLHADDTALVIQEDDILGSGTLAVEGFGNILGNQTACVVIVVISVAGGKLANLHRFQTGRFLGIGVVSGNTLTVTVVGIGIAIHAGGQGALGKPGQSALAPGGSLALVGSRTAHSIVADGCAAEAGQPVIGVTEGGSHKRTSGVSCILPFFRPTVKKKPPRP